MPKPGRLPVDFGKAAADYGRYRQGFPEEFFARLDELGIGRAGQRILDLGTGTGLLARALARRGCVVTGLDPSEDLIEEARRADAEAGLRIEYVRGFAEATGLVAGSFDVVCAATCWQWFDQLRAAREACRLLAPGGALVIAQLDRLRLPGNVVKATLDLIDRYAGPRRKARTRPGLEYPASTGPLSAAGFRAWEVFGFTTTLSYSHAAWKGRTHASPRVGPVMDAARLAAFDEALARMLAKRFPQDPLAVDHRVFALVAWTGHPLGRRSLPPA